MSAWEPIETAPRTTRAILVWCPERMNIYVVTWMDGEWCYFGGAAWNLDETPSHWQPLPEPPSEVAA